jgi:sugar lactone lactonase YvrE
LHRFDPALDSPNRETRWSVGLEIGAIAPCTTERAGVVLLTPEGFVRFHPGSGQRALLASVEATVATTRMNDGKCDSRGRFWGGSMARDESPGAGGLYILDTDGTLRKALEGVGISNGIGWSPDDGKMYYIDSLTNRVDVFDFDASTGEIANRRPFANVPESAGIPDGLCVDAEGFVWVALWGGGAVHRYAPDGSLSRVIKLPVTRPTSVAFGGTDLRDLYITTARCRLTDEQAKAQPHAGALFRCRPGATGMPPNVYRG